MEELQYIGSERINFCKKLKSIFEKEGFIVSIEQMNKVWNDYSKSVAWDWIYLSEDEYTDEELFKKLEEYYVRV